MAIIYTYPALSALQGSDLLLISDTSSSNSTKSVTLANIAAYVTGTGGGTGTTNTLTRWSDGPGGLLGDSIVAQNAGATILTVTGNFVTTGTGDFTGQVTIPLTPVATTDAASKGYVDTEIAGIPAGLIFQGNWDARNIAEGGASDQGSPDLATPALQVTGHYYVVTTAGSAAPNGPATTPNSWSVGDWVVFIEQGATDRWEKIDQTFIAGSGLTGQVTFWNSVNTVTGDNDFFWDDANKRLGLGTTTPHFNLQVNETTAATSACIQITNVDIGSTANDGLHLIASDTGNAYIQNRENGFLSLQTNGTEKMRILSTGEVGIGTATPLHNLQVSSAGNAEIQTQRVGGTGVLIQSQAAVGVIGTNTNHRLDLKTNSTTYMTITTSGDVGIGTVTPDEKLHILDTTGANIILNSNAVAANSGVYMSEGADATPTQNGAYAYYDGTNNEFRIATGAAALADRLAIARDTGAVQLNEYGAGTFTGTATYDLSVDVNGNIIESPHGSGTITGSGTATRVAFFDTATSITSTSASATDLYWDNVNTHLGIGTDSPGSYNSAARQLVAVSAGDAGVSIIGGTASTSSVLFGDGTGGTAAYRGSIRYDHATDDLYIATGATEKMRILDTGEVGIGVTPTALLQVTGGKSGDWAGRFENTHATGYGVLAKIAGTTLSDLIFQARTGATNVMTVTGIGKVGIGTDAPNNTLDVVSTTGPQFRVGYDTTHYLEIDVESGGDATLVNPQGSFESGMKLGTSGQIYLANVTTGGLDFATDTKLLIEDDGAIQFNEYGAGTFSGTATYDLSVDVNGNIIETTGGGAGGPFVPYMSGADQIARTECAATWNTSLGCQALQNLGAGVQNTIIGALAGDALTTGSDNTAIGYEALGGEDTGTKNTAVGSYALQDLNYGGAGYNTAIGYVAGQDISTGRYNVIVGAHAGDSITTGEYNVALGYNALAGEDAHGRNVAIGANALAVQDAGADAYNIAIGHEAGVSVSTGTSNVMVGGLAGDALTTGNHNIAIGREALSTEDGNGYNVAIGGYALQDLNAGADAYNVVIGYQAGTQMTTGTYNTVIGSQALGTGITTGTKNTAIGYQAGLNITDGANNVLIGSEAGDAITGGDRNVAIGHNALSSEDTGSRSTAIGYNALSTQNYGSNNYNVAVGYATGTSVASGVQNTLIGSLAGDAITDGANNVAIGYNALSTEATGHGAVAIGAFALEVLNAGNTYNTAIGFNAGAVMFQQELFKIQS